MRTMSDKTFTEILNAMMLDGAYTQADLADRFGIGRPYMSELMRGRRNPSVRLVHRICEAVGVASYDPIGRELHRAAARACGWEV